MGRVVFAENAGVNGLTDAEAARACANEALDASQVRTVDSSFAELGLYSQVFPFEGPGSGPALDESAVSNSGRAPTGAT